jgi:pimeloyl-ACP methyl ester carboxylesterase
VSARRLLPALLALLEISGARADPAAETVSFATADGGRVFADLYAGSGARAAPDAVVLAPGAVFDRKSWKPLAEALAAQGHRVLAIDFRGKGGSAGGTRPDAVREDILAAVRWLHARGASRVSVLGASRGGRAAAEASAASAPGEIDRLVLLSPAGIPEPEKLRGRTLLVASEQEPGVAQRRAQYARAPEPRRLRLLPGSAHAQHILATDQSAALQSEILDFLRGP